MNNYTYLEVLELEKKMKLIQDLNYEIDYIESKLKTININDEFKEEYYNFTSKYKKDLFNYRESLVNDILPFIHNCKMELFKEIKED
jgi:hypothetical protein